MSPGADALGLGQAWEARAARFLAARGIRVIERGYRCRLGEIDIVGVEGNMLVIVEVRARGRAGSALETVTRRKQRRIINATRHFLMRNPRWFSHRIRFDVVAIDRIDSGAPEIQWVKNAFDAA